MRKINFENTQILRKINFETSDFKQKINFEMNIMEVNLGTSNLI